MMAIVVAVALVVLASWSVIRLPALHPAQLWTIPWALATTLFAARLLPYKHMDVVAGILIVGGSVAFVLGTQAGERVLAGHFGSSPKRGDSQVPSSHISIGAGLVLAVLGLALAAFLAQIVHEFGVRATLISSPEVRLAIGAGGTSATIKYVYFAFAAVALSTLAAAREPDRRRSRRWIGVAILAGLSMYFATGRSNIIDALLIGLLTWGVARPKSITRSRVVLTFGAAVIVGLLIFSVGGAIIGKTFSANEVSTINSVFTRHQNLSILAIPYEYASAPIAGLQREVELSTTWGEGYGCATFAFVCQVLRKAGLHAEPEPAIRAATKAPLRWNTYTGLDFWLIDGGLALMAPIAFAFGAIMGGLWAGAKSGRAGMVIVYAIFGSTLLFSAYQNNFFAPQIVGSAMIVMAALLTGQWLVTKQQKATTQGVTGALRVP